MALSRSFEVVVGPPPKAAREGHVAYPTVIDRVEKSSDVNVIVLRSGLTPTNHCR